MSKWQFSFHARWASRDAAARADPHALLAAQDDPSSQILPLWRGKPHLCGDQLGWISADHAMLAHARRPWLYLGQHDGRSCFAADISSWEPDALDRAALAMFIDRSEQCFPGTGPGCRFTDLRLAMTQLASAEAALAGTARALFNWHRTHQFCAACGQRSEIALAGWERHCPACGAKHFPRTDPVVIMLVLHGNHVLLGRSQGWPEKMYSALAGFIEPGETMEAAVAREVMEETGIPIGKVHYIASQPWPFPNSLMLGTWARAQSTVITRDDELEDARWFSREEILRAWHGAHPDLLPAREGAIAHYMIGQWLAGRLGSA